MIVTRQRPKKKFNPRSVLLPLAALVVLGFALWWPPSQKKIVGFVAYGPLAPVWRLAGNVLSPLLTPLHFAAQEQVIADRNKSIETLSGQIEDERKQIAARDTQIAALQSQVKAVQAAAAHAAEATPTPAPVRKSSANTAAEVATITTDDPKHTATVWSAMEPEAAAAVAQRLPADYTAKVLSLMNADSAGSLLGALPPAYAAKVSQVSTAVPK